MSFGGLSKKTSYGLSIEAGSIFSLSFRQKIPVDQIEYGSENWAPTS